MGGAYGTQHGGIEFDGVPDNFEVKNGKKNAREIRFTINDKENRTEQYRVLIYMYPNLRTTININSTHRTFIMYRGTASEIKKTPVTTKKKPYTKTSKKTSVKRVKKPTKKSS